MLNANVRNSMLRVIRSEFIPAEIARFELKWGKLDNLSDRNLCKVHNNAMSKRKARSW